LLALLLDLLICNDFSTNNRRVFWFFVFFFTPALNYLKTIFLFTGESFDDFLAWRIDYKKKRKKWFSFCVNQFFDKSLFFISCKICTYQENIGNKEKPFKVIPGQVNIRVYGHKATFQTGKKKNSQISVYFKQICSYDCIYVQPIGNALLIFRTNSFNRRMLYEINTAIKNSTVCPSYIQGIYFSSENH